jgi:hypothetical protein
MLTVGDEVHRIVVRRLDRAAVHHLGRGFRHEVEALDERMRAIRSCRATAAGGPAPLVAPMPG